VSELPQTSQLNITHSVRHALSSSQITALHAGRSPADVASENIEYGFGWQAR
jgi:hypothetical protein